MRLIKKKYKEICIFTLLTSFFAVMGGVYADLNDRGVSLSTSIEDKSSNEEIQNLMLSNSNPYSMDINVSEADASFIGEDGWDHAGETLAAVGDVNGDGYDDILIGAPDNDDMACIPVKRI
ncbi:MAG: integrin alpha [Promethearchaeota archaeon]